jgi:integrase
VIPKARMKGNAEHIVPLPPRCMQILAEARGPTMTGGLIFPGRFTDEPLSEMTFTKILRDMDMGDRVTAHGFRTSFRTWCAETNQCRWEVAEAALAHAIRDKTEAAYHRTSYLEERAGLMDRWCDFSAGTA